jgi:cobalamin biosynthesis protein CobD/CbiB
MWKKLATLGVALVWDRFLGEPPAYLHPVVGIGRAISLAIRQPPGLDSRLDFKRGAVLAGNVMPAARGSVSVTLLRKRGSAFRRVSAKTGVLNIGGAFAVSFGRPRGGTCQIRAAYRGDSNHLPSSMALTFRC